MKKFLALFLVFALFISSFAMLTSCEEKVPDNPSESTGLNTETQTGTQTGTQTETQTETQTSTATESVAGESSTLNTDNFTDSNIAPGESIDSEDVAESNTDSNSDADSDANSEATTDTTSNNTTDADTNVATDGNKEDVANTDVTTDITSNNGTNADTTVATDSNNGDATDNTANTETTVDSSTTSNDETTATDSVTDSNKGDSTDKDLTDALNKANVEKDPYAALSKIFNTTSTNFFVVDDNVKNLLNGNSKKVSRSLKLEGSDAFPIKIDGEYCVVTATIYTDSENQYVVMSGLVDGKDKDHSANVYMTSKDVVLSMSDISKVLKVDFETLPTKFKSSALFEMSGLGAEENKETVDELISLLEGISSAFDISYEESLKLANEYIAIFMGDIEEDELTVKIPFTFNTTTIKEYISKSFDQSNKILGDIEDFAEVKDQYLAEIDRNLAGTELKFDVIVTKATYELAKIDMTIKLGEYLVGENLNLKGEIVFTDDKITLTGSTKVNGENYGLNAEISKNINGNVTTFTFFANVNYSNDSTEATMKLVNGTVVYNTQTGDIKVDVSVPQAESSYTLNMNLKVDGKKIIFGATSMSGSYPYYDYIYDEVTEEYTETKTMKNETLTFLLQYTIDFDPTIPAMPTDASDIMDLSQSDWEAIISEFEVLFPKDEEIYEETDDEFMTDEFDTDFDFEYDSDFDFEYDSDFDFEYDSDFDFEYDSDFDFEYDSDYEFDFDFEYGSDFDYELDADETFIIISTEVV